MGIDLDSSSYPTQLRELAQRAQAGDKRAQLELGIAFEEGRGVERGLKAARSPYMLAASDSGGPIWVYLRGVNGSSGRVMQVDAGPKQAGLIEVRRRVSSLDQWREKNEE